MNKAVMISIQPKWCELIASGKKAIEVRKSKPKLDTPFKCYIYETNGRYIKSVKGACTKFSYGIGKVIGEFVCNYIDEFDCDSRAYRKLAEWSSCLTEQEIINYSNGQTLYAWDISQLKIYDKSKDLSEFKRMCGCYDDEMHCADYCSFYKLGMCDGRCSKLTRPPQSWCYVEELEE